MKRNGFTLVELLAVLVVLALIALIVTPNVARSIKDYQDRLYDVQIDGIKDSAKNWLADQIDQGISYNIPKEEKSIFISVGELQEDGYVDPDLKDPRNSKKLDPNTCIKINYANYQYTYESMATCSLPTHVIGEVVYFDPILGETCDSYTEKQSHTGVNTGCMKWYVYKNNGVELGLLLDHNTTPYIEWNSDGTNQTIKEAMDQLKIDTNRWRIEADLIEGQDIASITGNTNWNPGSSIFYLDTNTEYQSPTCNSDNTSGCKYGWLYDRTSPSCNSYGCLNNSTSSEDYAYWTKTAYTGNRTDAWQIYNNQFVSTHVQDDFYGPLGGVRPVLTLPIRAI